MIKKAILLINIGTPDKPEVKHVRKYLGEFLNDPLVIDIPWLLRILLVNGIIIPFRAKKSTRLYQKLWTADGSPLLIHLNGLCKKVQELLPEGHRVYGAMRYGNPSIKTVMDQIEADHPDKIIILPLYPQFASSTTLSTLNKVLPCFTQWKYKPSVYFIEQFYNHPAFINAFAQNITRYNLAEYDHIVFTYHGLPIRQVASRHPHIPFNTCTCEKEMPEHGQRCYKALCYETTRLLVKQLNIPTEKTSVGFQSRLSNTWLTPFTDEIIVQLAKNGAKRVLVVAPSFVADCLETIVEIKDDYSEIFKHFGGISLDLVESLNATDVWANGIIELTNHKTNTLMVC